jgi:succinate dehydrogenase flavin-adding protein (antitoxin of CptAB toxin-antitoxin module)
MNLSYHFRKVTNNSGQFVKYLTLEQDVDALRGQMLYRSKNLGVKELDLIVGSWALNFLKTLNYDQLVQYNKEVIQQETPDLTKKLLGEMPIDES